MIYSRTKLVIDTETTGFTKGSSIADIIDIAVVEYPTGKVLYESLIRPSVKISEGAIRVHGITEETVFDAPDFHEVWSELNPILQNNKIYAYNATFDKGVLEKQLLRYGFSLSADWECVMRKFQAFYRLPKVVKLSQACEMVNVVAGNHRAKEDALAAARVLYRMDNNYRLK